MHFLHNEWCHALVPRTVRPYMKIRSKVWLENNKGLVFGSGKAMILKSIARTGSISKAAVELNMSYRHAWSYIKSAEKRLNKKLVICIKGGKNGGGAKLTDYAKGLLEDFLKLEHKAALFTDKCFDEIFLSR